MHVIEGPRYNMYTNELKNYKRAVDTVKHRRTKSNKRNEGVFSPTRNPLSQPAHFMPVGGHDTASAGLLIEVAQIIQDRKCNSQMTF
jgi:hypothetical protein